MLKKKDIKHKKKTSKLSKDELGQFVTKNTSGKNEKRSHTLSPQDTIPLHEAKAHFSHYVNKAFSGQSYIITKHGHPIAELKPYTPISEERHKRAITSLKKMSLNRKPMSDKMLKAMISEGRD